MNGGSWTPATTSSSWTNWTASVILINPGANAISAYAVDSSGSISHTNTVKFTYVPTAPLAVQVTGLGTVTPNYNGKWLKIGTRYSMTAKAGKGFAFLKWFGSLATNQPTLTFVMASNLTFIAKFVDVTPPVAVILSPKVHQTVSNALFTVTGKASDNVGVTQVLYQLNDTGWEVAATANGLTNWTAQVTLSPGTNVVAAYAEDAAGNRSKTNSVSFVYQSSAAADWAPASLSGLSAEAVRAGESPSTLCFGASTLSQGMLPGTNEDQNGVGAYTYTKLGTNTAQMTVTWTDPPNRTNDGGTASLTFTNSHAAVYVATNLDGTIDSGALLFSPAADLAPASLEGETVRSVDSASGQASTTVFGNGTFNQTDYQGNVSSGSYTLTRSSPVGILVVMSYSSPASMAGAVNYSVAIFSAPKAGIWFSDFFNPAGGSNTNSGTFTLP